MPRLTGDIDDRPRKKLKQVTGNKPKLSTLAQLKKVNQDIKKIRGVEDKESSKRFRKMDKLFDKKRKLSEKLGIDS